MAGSGCHGVVTSRGSRSWTRPRDVSSGTRRAPWSRPTLRDAHEAVLCWPESAALGGDPAQPPGWCGDTDSTCYMEGAALYKHDGWWYVFGTYGNLEADYTIRMGRLRSPRGPFVDKAGVDLTRYDVGLGRYGASMFLAGEGRCTFPATLTRGGRAIVTSSATTGGASLPTTAIGWPCARCASSTGGRRSGRRSRSCSGWTTSLRRKVGRTSRWASRTWAGRGRWRFRSRRADPRESCGGVRSVCPGEPNSAAASGARLAFVGSPSVAADDLRIAVSDAPGGRSGLLVAGGVSGAAPVGDVILCIGPPRRASFPPRWTRADA